MTPLKDPALLAKFIEVLREWNCGGYINWKSRPAEWLRKNLSNVTQKAVGQAMYEHVMAGGEIDQVIERREEYTFTHTHHYDFRIFIDDRFLYIETVLNETRTGPIITIVNLKDV